ncbi:hypothetical protein L6452_08421 [Arctium lappa]|uniref:Uncharacterized protein n=1 Tax=Arctium lappa TaxID=4217 RepID=A0ACB9DIC0_ARCLA|nr:hypothetical protein L6452_08421 [Arctium lappa]
MLAGRVEQIPRTDIATVDPIMTEVNPQTQMIDMMRAMNETMAKQQDLFMKLLEDREVNHRRHETIEENVVIAGFGGTEDENRTEGLVTLETRQPENGCSYKSFLCCKPPEFSGTDEPVRCMNWLREIEQAFRACECDESQKVKYGSQMLRAKMAWAEFKRKLLEEYCNEEEMDLLEEEFRSIKKGNLSVKEYTRLFMEKLNLVGHVVPTEKEKVKAYLKGLPADMMSMVRNYKASNLRETIEEAKVMERFYARDKEEKAKVGEPAEFVQDTEVSIGSSGSQPRREVIPKAQGRAFQMTKEEAKETTDVVSGTFLLNSIPARVLFDSGANFSFMSVIFCKSLSVPISTLRGALVIEVANGEQVILRDILRDCRLEISGESFMVDLLPMTIGSFDVVIGMDWLEKHQAEILCSRKLIRIPIRDGDFLTVYGEKRKGEVAIISSIKARKYLTKKYPSYLAFVV